MSNFWIVAMVTNCNGKVAQSSPYGDFGLQNSPIFFIKCVYMCLHSIKYLTCWHEHNFAHMALRSQYNSNVTGGYESPVVHSYIGRRRTI